MTVHKHHIIPRHMGGSDDPSNLIELSIEDHARAHEKMFNEHGRWQDMIAWKALSGLVTMSEASKLARVEGCKLGGRITYEKHGLPHERMSEEGAKRHAAGRRLGALAQPKEAKARGGKNNTMETRIKAGKAGGKMAVEMGLGIFAPENRGMGGRIGGKIGGKVAIPHLLSLRHLCHECGKVTTPKWMNHHKAKTGHIITVQI
jgi:hypothetical protein